MWSDEVIRAVLRQVFDAGIASADPARVLPAHLPRKPRGRCVVIGAGKASAAMAAALDVEWPDVDLSGVVVTRYGHAVPAGRIRIIEASHPVPDDKSEIGARAVLAALRGLSRDDTVIALISGGGSSLLALPVEGMTLADKQRITRELLRSGATIREINAVRKHISAVKGGRLAAAAWPARLVTLAISDVPGDDPSSIASGPTVADSSTLEDVDEIMLRYDLQMPPSMRRALDRATETPKPGEVQGEFKMIASPSIALDAAAVAAKSAGFTPVILGDAIEGESREVGIVMAGISRSACLRGAPVKPPAIILSGGETSVTIQDGEAGRGGRNTEFLLSMAVALGGEKGIWALAGDSDGIDGSEDAAGAIIAPDTLVRARAMGLDARDFLSRHDSYTFFREIGDLVHTGPTLTNVNDIRAVVVT